MCRTYVLEMFVLKNVPFSSFDIFGQHFAFVSNSSWNWVLVNALMFILRTNAQTVCMKLKYCVLVKRSTEVERQ